MGAGLSVTRKRNRRGSSQTSIGSTNGPVEKSQYRVAPEPEPSRRTRVGYASPARKNHSLGSGSSGNVTTYLQTCSGGAAMSIVLRTSNTGGGDGAAPK